MWLRYDKEWKDLVYELLIHGQVHITKYINSKHIEKTINKHMQAEGSYMRDIIRWMTMEMLIRSYEKNINNSKHSFSIS